MAAKANPGAHIAAPKPCISASHRISKSRITFFSNESKGLSQTMLRSSSFISCTQLFSKSYDKNLLKSKRNVIKAMSASNDQQPLPGLPIDLRGKRAFIAGVADDNGYGWAIAKSLAAAGAEILVGTWVPALNIFETGLRRGKFGESRMLPDGSLMEIAKIYPLDAVYDSPEEVPEDVKTNKRYSGYSKWTVKEVAELVKRDFGNIDILVHSLANGPEEVGNAAAFLASPLASAITGAVVCVDNGLNAMGVGVDSPVFQDLDIPKANKN